MHGLEGFWIGIGTAVIASIIALIWLRPKKPEHKPS